LEERETASKTKQPSLVRRAIEANAKRQKLEQNPDADDPVDSDRSDEENSDDDDDDDTATLLAELNKIKRERMQDQAKREAEKKQDSERIRMENILSGNPLLSYASAPKGNVKVKRRWNDDVVFKNCARSEIMEKNDFINDSLRSEFHKKFMEKYIK